MCRVKAVERGSYRREGRHMLPSLILTVARYGSGNFRVANRGSVCTTPYICVCIVKVSTTPHQTPLAPYSYLIHVIVIKSACW